MTRYIHLNPVKAGLVARAEDCFRVIEKLG
jgi:hypothetical protein